MNFDLDNISIIFGLGNIGKEYENSRHNIGFKFLDTLAPQDSFRPNSKLEVLESSVFVNNKKIYLCKPTTQMNLSGRAVAKYSSFLSVAPENILVIYDELDIAMGDYKIQFAKASKTHNGINSINKYIGTQNYWRMRIGVDGRTTTIRQKVTPAEYVLSPISKKTRDIFSKTFEQIKADIGFVQ